MNFKTALGRLRLMGLMEGISWACLLVAMLLKYFPGETGANHPDHGVTTTDQVHAVGKTAVTIVGSIHGGLFMLYLLAVVNAWIDRKWGFGRAFLAALASFPPFGTFVFDGTLKREQLSESTPSPS